METKPKTLPVDFICKINLTTIYQVFEKLNPLTRTRPSKMTPPILYSLTLHGCSKDMGRLSRIRCIVFWPKAALHSSYDAIFSATICSCSQWVEIIFFNTLWVIHCSNFRKIVGPLYPQQKKLPVVPIRSCMHWKPKGFQLVITCNKCAWLYC